MHRTETHKTGSCLLCGVAALWITSAAQAASTVDFSLELQDAGASPYSTYVTDWKTGSPSLFPAGQNSDGQTYDIGDLITWDAVIAASGTQDTGAGAGYDIYGVANYVFDLELRECLGVDVNDACTDEGALIGTGVFVSQINDGTGGDPTREAAFTVSYDVGGAGPARIIDPATSGGPNLSQYNLSLTTLTGELVGLGSGYGVPWTASTMTPGVGMTTLPDLSPGLGVVPVEEGQIDTSSLPAGTYVLKLIPDDGFGMNVLRGDVDLSQDQQAYATGAEVVNGDSVTFFLQVPPTKPVVLTAVSQKTHTGAGNRDIDLKLAGSADPLLVEPRNDGPTRMVFTFDQDVNITGAVVTLSVAWGSYTPTLDDVVPVGTDGMEVQVSGISTSDLYTYCVKVDISGVTGTVGGLAMDPVRYLIMPLLGDVNGDGWTDTADINLAKEQSGQFVWGPEDADFRRDFNLDAWVDSGDINIAKAESGNSCYCDE
jgi:hypothetical protein